MIRIRPPAAWGKEWLQTVVHRIWGLVEMWTPSGIRLDAGRRVPLTIDSARRKALADKLRQALAELPDASAALSREEEALVRGIREQTAFWNRSNLTRTRAYCRIWRDCPELHWALLAHMVSRNAGWNMTDLKGELLSRLLNGRQQTDLFGLLEASNAMIFHDAYPQLLLYRESLRTSAPLFHLLPRLQVSRFMRPVWEQFWDTRSSSMLTVCLIINEQHVVETILEDPYLLHHVLRSWYFRLQSAFKLNQLYFPEAPGLPPHCARLYGSIVDHFPAVSDRIATGRELYGILFGTRSASARIQQFARSHVHTGSRADYWPHVFTAEEPEGFAANHAPRLDGGRLKPGASKLYSPRLTAAWPERPFDPPERSDWFCSTDVLAQIKTPAAPLIRDVTDACITGLNALELAAAAGGRRDAATK